MHLVGARHVRSALANHGPTNDQRRTVGLFAQLFSLGDRSVNLIDLVGVCHSDDVPPIGLEALGRVVCKPVFHLAINRNAVVVVEDDELGQSQRAGQ